MFRLKTIVLFLLLTITCTFLTHPIDRKASASNKDPQIIINDEIIKNIRQFKVSTNGILLAFYVNGKEGHKVLVWDTLGAKIVLEQNIEHYIDDIDILPNNNQIVVSLIKDDWTSLIRLYDINGGKLLYEIDSGQVETEAGNPIYHSSKGSVLLSTPGNILGWDTNAGKKLFEIKCKVGKHYICPVSASKHGNVFAAGFINGDIKTYSSKSGRLLKEFKMGKGKVEVLEYSNNGRYIASCGNDNQTLTVWNSLTGEKVLSTDYNCTSVRFSLDSKLLVISYFNNDSGEEGIKILQIKNGKSIRELKSYRLRNLIGKGKYILANSIKGFKVNRGFEILSMNNFLQKYRFVILNSFDWIICSPSGHFDASPGAKKYIKWEKDDKEYSGSTFWDEYYQPGLFQKVMTGKD